LSGEDLTEHILKQEDSRVHEQRRQIGRGEFLLVALSAGLRFEKYEKPPSKAIHAINLYDTGKVV
jgi:hypothetical protein